MDPTRVWIRVPVYAGEMGNLNTTVEVRITELTGRPEPATRLAQPVAAPPSANAVAATVDLYYQLANPDAALRPGQRLAVLVPERGDEEALVIPWSAVVLDIYGGEWVY